MLLAVLPQILALMISSVVGYGPDLVTLFRGNREQRLRFAVGGTNAYIYYGWRYAFRQRTRPWGALSMEEKVATNPGRAGAGGGDVGRRNYWPE